LFRDVVVGVKMSPGRELSGCFMMFKWVSRTFEMRAVLSFQSREVAVDDGAFFVRWDAAEDWLTWKSVHDAAALI